VANFAKNESLCVELTDELDAYTTSEPFTYMTDHKIVVGEPFDQIYTRGFIRNEADRILINELGLPVVSPGKTIPMGHSNPDWTGGLTNSFKWKGLTAGVLIDVRMGGDVFSFTEANLSAAGFSEVTIEGRDGFIVDGVMASDGSENTTEITAEAYWLSMGGRNTPVGELYRYNASFVRVREVMVGYVWKLQTPVVQSIGLSLYGRNLGFLYNAAEIIDPGLSSGTGNLQGVESYSLPTSRTFGFNANFKF
jgi:hypothetical protein